MRLRLFALLLACCAPGVAGASEASERAARDLQRIDAALAAMPAQRPGAVDLYVVGFAGDGNEQVFGNEVAYLRTLMAQRHGNEGRTLVLANRPDARRREDTPLATLDNLRHALAGIAATMDPEEDLLLVYLASHGTARHQLAVGQPGLFETFLKPTQLRVALDDAGIPRRVVIVSACYSGGFIPALQDAGTIVLTAARHDRTSFGCGDTESATYFGRALLVEGMNRDGGLLDAFQYARRQVARREKMDRLTPSEPQMDVGSDALARLQAWEAGAQRGPVAAYPHD
ncbi:C13 family peptidase [Luteimonas aestuarii]|nr:C13 family peptidase [Luteimonas aestuarii]